MRDTFTLYIATIQSIILLAITTTMPLAHTLFNQLYYSKLPMASQARAVPPSTQPGELSTPGWVFYKFIQPRLNKFCIAYP